MPDICVVKIVFPAYFQYHIANKIINSRRLTDLTKKCVYTAVSGGYDGVLQHDYVAEDYDYIFFTDNQKLLKKQKLGHWTVRPLAFRHWIMCGTAGGIRRIRMFCFRIMRNRFGSTAMLI